MKDYTSIWLCKSPNVHSKFSRGGKGSLMILTNDLDLYLTKIFMIKHYLLTKHEVKSFLDVHKFNVQLNVCISLNGSEVLICLAEYKTADN